MKWNDMGNVSDSHFDTKNFFLCLHSINFSNKKRINFFVCCCYVCVWVRAPVNFPGRPSPGLSNKLRQAVWRGRAVPLCVLCCWLHCVEDILYEKSSTEKKRGMWMIYCVVDEWNNLLCTFFFGLCMLLIEINFVRIIHRVNRKLLLETGNNSLTDKISNYFKGMTTDFLAAFWVIYFSDCTFGTRNHWKLIDILMCSR